LQSATFFRPQLARDVGGWRSEYFACDLDLWLRMVFHTDVARVPAVVSVRRLHPAQRDSQHDEIWKSYWQMIEDSEDIKRADLRTRLAAKAGRRLFVQHYNPTGSAWHRSRQMWLALVTYPPSVHAVRDAGLLFPYTDSLRSLLSRVRRTRVSSTR
jgi:hypothetical protein